MSFVCDIWWFGGLRLKMSEFVNGAMGGENEISSAKTQNGREVKKDHEKALKVFDF